MVRQAVRARQVVTPNRAAQAAKRRGRRHIDLSDVGIVGFAAIVRDDALQPDIHVGLDPADR